VPNNWVQSLSVESLSPMLRFLAAAPELQWAYGIAATLGATAFFSISCALVWFVRKRVNPRANWLFLLFATLMFICGCSALVSLWTGWAPVYRLDAALRVAAAALAAIIGILIWPVLAKLAPLPGSARLQQEIAQREQELAQRRDIEEALRRSQATLRELAAYQERIREDERKRIAREIHDELGQNLLALRLDIAALHERAGARRPLLRERAATALEYIDTTMKSIRTIMNNLRPSVLDLGLPAAIEWQVGQFQRRSGVHCELMMDDEGDGMAVPDEQAIAVFRILQESLNNIGRHAQATLVRVELRIDEQRLAMAIKDNGVGMYPGDRRKLRRFGLVGIEERVTILGGDLDIESTPGQGTVVRLSIPMQVRADAAAAEVQRMTSASMQD
jgi:signal transduction histidine kinase